VKKKTASIVLASILLITALLWLVLNKSSYVLLLGVIAVVGVAVVDMFLELKHNPPKRIRSALQAIVCCVGGTAVIAYGVVYLVKSIF
jgi:UDP-N-acetylmuramyl pentapeptide phosphotransferase/UDP-N-acetylglucosamine-1-phosphate transferase